LDVCHRKSPFSSYQDGKFGIAKLLRKADVMDKTRKVSPRIFIKGICTEYSSLMAILSYVWGRCEENVSLVMELVHSMQLSSVEFPASPKTFSGENQNCNLMLFFTS
jgi:hypothetical protein